MKLAPIVLFVYNRPEHTRIALQSLSECQYADQSDLYIFADQAKNEKAKEQVEQVRCIIKEDIWKRKFAEVNITEAAQNKGLANSVISGVTQVINKYGRVIVVEDDNRVAPDFLDYMNRGLEYYENNHRIGYIGGYKSPIKIPEDYKKDVFLMGRGSSYAWGTWKDRGDLVDWDVKDFKEFEKDKKAIASFNEYGEDRFEMLKNQVEGNMNSWAIRFSYAMWKHNMFAVLPCKTRVENIGFDGSGVHNVAQDTRFTVSIESDLSPVKFEDLSVDERIKREIQKMFKIPLTLRIKRKIKHLLRERKK